MGVIIPYTLHSLQRLVRCDGAGLIFLHVVIFFSVAFYLPRVGMSSHSRIWTTPRDPATQPAGQRETTQPCFVLRYARASGPWGWAEAAAARGWAVVSGIARWVVRQLLLCPLVLLRLLDGSTLAPAAMEQAAACVQ